MKTKKKLLIGTAIMALAAGGASAVSTFAWFRAGASASLSTATTETATASVASSISDALSLGITFTINVSGSAVMVNDKGEEKVWLNGTELKNLDNPTPREGITRYFTVTVQATGFAEGATAEQKAAALGKTYSVTPTVTGSRFVAHATGDTLAVGTSGWHTAGTIPTISDIAVSYSSDYSITSSQVTFYVVVKGGDDSQKDFTGTTNANNITATIGLGTITVNSN